MYLLAHSRKSGYTSDLSTIGALDCCLTGIHWGFHGSGAKFHPYSKYHVVHYIAIIISIQKMVIIKAVYSTVWGTPTYGCGQRPFLYRFKLPVIVTHYLPKTVVSLLNYSSNNAHGDQIKKNKSWIILTKDRNNCHYSVFIKGGWYHFLLSQCDEVSATRRIPGTFCVFWPLRDGTRHNFVKNKLTWKWHLMFFLFGM